MPQDAKNTVDWHAHAQVYGPRGDAAITTPRFGNVGGLNHSGASRDTSLHDLETYTEHKTTWIDLA